MGPTIIIGLGGVGSEIVAMVEAQMRTLSTDSHRKLRPLIRFAIVDTDVSALRQRRRNDFSGTVVQISDNMTVEKYLYHDKEAGEWFPPCQILSKKTLTEGAGQVRAISRLALNLALQNQDRLKPLYDAIDELHLMGESNSEQPTRVIIVSSLAGGTGSGIFLPFAMHLQEYLRQNYRNTEPIFKGFFIMPSVFDFVAEQAERRSLNANGYAAIKELNAFTMLRDRQIDRWRYPDLKIELPNGHEQKRKYYYSPYDLCFLFEKQNQDDKHLLDFDESKRNIANCVWMQTVNPVLEENGSLEDNLFKIVSTASKDKRYERFAGMGIAQLKYPYKDMEPYFSMVMAETVVKNDWYAADIAWERQIEIWETEGEGTLQIQKEEFYLDFAENKSEWEKFTKQVKEDAWCDTYLEGVKQLTTKRFEDNPGKELSEYQNSLDTLLGDGDNYNPDEWGETRVQKFDEAYDKIIQEQKLILVRNRDFLCQKLLAEFQQPKRNHLGWKEYQIEYWLLGKDGARSPIENRYFLVLLEKNLKARQEELDRNIEELREKGEKYQQTIRKLRDFSKRRIRRGTREFKKCVREMRSSFEAILDRFRLELLNEIYKELFNRVENLWRVYDTLLRDYIEWVNEEKRELKKNLLDHVENHDGRTIRLVCSSATCLERMEEIVRSSARDSTLEASFAGKFCIEVLRQQDRGADADAKHLKSFWIDSYTKAAGAKLDVDVLTALENEACWEYEKKHKKVLDKEDKLYNDTVRRYMKDEAFGKLRNIFVRAFLRIPNAKHRHVMQMCIYPSGIPKDNVLLNSIVDKELKKYQGRENSEDTCGEKYQIDFYRAIFGVSASEISAFLHEDEISPLPSGDGYNDYTVMIDSLDWQNRRENFLTPHIDWRWHKITAVPELSEEYGKIRYGNLLKATLFGLLIGKIKHNDNNYKVGMLNGQAFDRSQDMHLIDTLSQLVDFVDESPVIRVHLEDLKRNPSKWEEQPRTMLKKIVELAIEEYGEGRLARNFSSDEMADIMEDILLELVYLVEIKDKYHKLKDAVSAEKRALDELLLDAGKYTKIMKQMKDHLTERRVEEYLTMWMRKLE